jgi:hypothetical protein
MGWAEELTEENFYAIYDVALDIRADLQLGQPPSIPMVPSLIKFPVLMPADGINMRDRYGNLRWKAMKFLESKSVIQRIDIQQHGHRWDARAELKVDAESFKETFATLESELRRRTVPDETVTEVTKPMEKSTKLESPEFDKVTLLWLVHYLPLKLWISALGIVAFVFVAGMQVGQIGLVREFLGKPSLPQATTIEPSVLQNRIDRLTEGYTKNVAQITAQILSEEQAAGKTFYISEQQPHIDAANRLRALLDNEHKKYREAINELRSLQTAR